ncbi:hypothetical protein D3C72_1166690 [compost metagenome]
MAVGPYPPRAEAGAVVRGPVQQLLHVLGRHVRAGHQQHAGGADLGDEGQFLAGVVWQLRIQELIVENRLGQRDADRVAIGRCLGHHIRADHAGRARAVLDDDRLAQALAHVVGERAGDDVGGAARGEWQDEGDRAVGVGRLRGRGLGEACQHEHAGLLEHSVSWSARSGRASCFGAVAGRGSLPPTPSCTARARHDPPGPGGRWGGPAPHARRKPRRGAASRLTPMVRMLPRLYNAGFPSRRILPG